MTQPASASSSCAAGSGTTSVDLRRLLQGATTTSQKHNEAYGYLFWLNDTNTYLKPSSDDVQRGNRSPDLPRDVVSADGAQFNVILTSKSLDLVVVLLGKNPKCRAVRARILQADLRRRRVTRYFRRASKEKTVRSSAPFLSMYSSISSSLGVLETTPPFGTSPLATQTMAFRTVMRKSSCCQST